MTFALSFGSYTFAPGWYVSQIEMTSNVPSTKLPRADGARLLTGYLEQKRFQVRGGFIHTLLPNTGGLTLRQALDALKGALRSGPANFTLDSDRYWRNCQQATYSDTYEATEYNRIVSVSFDLVTGDPFSYETATQSGTQAITASGQSLALTPGGNAYARPQISLTVGTTGTLAATLTHETTGEAFTLAGAVTAGDVLIVDTLDETVMRAGVDVTALFDGIFPRLLPGVANALQVTYTSSAITSLAATWQNRWY